MRGVVLVPWGRKTEPSHLIMKVEVSTLHPRLRHKSGRQDLWRDGGGAVRESFLEKQPLESGPGWGSGEEGARGG